MMKEIQGTSQEKNRVTERDEFLGVTFDETAIDERQKRTELEQADEIAKQEVQSKIKHILERGSNAPSRDEGTQDPERQNRNVPRYLQSKVNGNAAGELLDAILHIDGMGEARNNLPSTGPFLVISNHSGGETGMLLALLKNHDVHIAAGDELNFKRSSFRSWLLKKLRMIPVKESLAGLTEQEKDELLERVPGRAKAGYRKIIEHERSGEATMNNDFLRSAVAVLARGDVVVAFPEGLFLYDGKKSLRKAYGGVELLAKRYKKMTGKDLPIVPVAVIPADKEAGRKKQIAAGEPFIVGETMNIHSMMGRLAKIMPNELRGIYGQEST